MQWFTCKPVRCTVLVGVVGTARSRSAPTTRQLWDGQQYSPRGPDDRK